MTTRDLFIIILRIIGLFFFKDLVISSAGVMPLLSSFGLTDDPSLKLMALMSVVVGIGIYIVLLYFFIYRAEWLVDKLRLTEGIPNVLPLAIHRSTVLSIAIFVIGGLILSTEIPNLCRLLFMYAQERNIGERNSDISDYLLLTIVKVVIGVILINKQRQLVAFIEARRKHL
ncbi:hypothetical protein [Hymenobacter lapidiphilus]|uniref:Uncharacterized protein n=1 Tax=Hymenobacter lapidiphilus TaxID=2608003 RepID=A0A7Y7PRW5_9BACT|nr:hypothetical protein [Hymenobacter lapidiphilus]NVO32901.1 hypothetical protein [Hymenobacter lapidiphilus]